MAGLCIVAFGWLLLTMAFEVQMGMPSSSVQWIKRIIGWAVELWLARTLLRGCIRLKNFPAGR